MADAIRLLVIEDHTRDLIRNLSGDQLQAAARAGMFPIVNEAKRRAPYKTGDLKDSIHVEDNPERTATRASALGGTDLIYAARQEFGFQGPDSLGRVYHDPGRPYLRPAFDTMSHEAESEVHAALAQLIQRAVS